jgi:GNAT superfamily N-acetyltransferase
MFHQTANWHRFKTTEAGSVERFLKAQEGLCVTAASRFFSHRQPGDTIWVCSGNGEITGMLVDSSAILFPVFTDRPVTPLQPILRNRVLHTPVYAIHGIYSSVVIVERALADLDCQPVERINYDLMEYAGTPQSLPQLPHGLLFRKPVETDTEELCNLHAAYEKEEVITGRTAFNPAICRLTVERMIKNEHILLAEMDSHLIGKINTNASAFSRVQIGGVYVLPDYRRHGIASLMGSVFVQELRDSGLISTLFVKKQNTAAHGLYRRIGFTVLDDYRISYYQ